VTDQIVPVQAAVKEHLVHTAATVHLNETGIRVDGKLRWTHVASTEAVTYLAVHDKRGAKALEEIGIFPWRKGQAIVELTQQQGQPALSQTQLAGFEARYEASRQSAAGRAATQETGAKETRQAQEPAGPLAGPQVRSAGLYVRF